MSAETEEFLSHFGKKGMKWGVRNESSGAAPSGTAPTLSRREVRKVNKAGRIAYDTQKISDVYDEAKKKGESVLVTSRASDGINNVMTGKDFVDHIEAGGWVEGGTTRIFARQAKAGEQFVLNNFQDEQYTPIKRK